MSSKWRGNETSWCALCSGQFRTVLALHFNFIKEVSGSENEFKTPVLCWCIQYCQTTPIFIFWTRVNKSWAERQNSLCVCVCAEWLTLRTSQSGSTPPNPDQPLTLQKWTSPTEDTHWLQQAHQHTLPVGSPSYTLFTEIKGNVVLQILLENDRISIQPIKNKRKTKVTSQALESRSDVSVMYK